MIEKIIENFAICSSFEELNLEPKPGLVTPTSKGSHKDMDYEIMKAGIESLVGYYSEAFSYGFFWVRVLILCENWGFYSKGKCIKKLQV